ncbi:MAG: hypothetical protein E6J52_06090 [Chloroflexi bacterium]|nr:MAG: hypothetical protein E6J52_06090 [Chloroflexota bacterium]
MPTTDPHVSAPTDTSGTAIEPGDQTIALRSSGTTAGASASDPTSADMTAAFCVLAHANEENGAPTADVSSVCGNSPSTAGATGFSDEAGAGSANNGLGGSLCLVGNANATTPATASLSTACSGTSPSTANKGGGTNASDGTTITPAMRASVCANAQASADLSSSAEFITVCGAPQSSAAENAWTPRATSANAAGSSAEGLAAAFIASLPFTGTASLPVYGGGLLLIGAGLAILLRSRKTS